MRISSLLSAVAVGTFLSVAQTAAQTNVANYNLNPNAKAFASDSGAYGSRPSGATDGNTNTNYNYSGDFYHSPLEAQAWWYVDLGAQYDISKVVFFYRTDCCSWQNDGNLLRIFAAQPDFTTDFNNPGAALFSATLDDDVSGIFTMGLPVTGRYVALSSPAQSGNHAIVAAEVEVYGVDPVDAVAPEPASLVLMVTGLVGIAAAHKRKARVV